MIFVNDYNGKRINTNKFTQLKLLYLIEKKPSKRLELWPIRHIGLFGFFNDEETLPQKTCVSESSPKHFHLNFDSVIVIKVSDRLPIRISKDKHIKPFQKFPSNEA